VKEKIGYGLILCSFLPWAGLPVLPLLQLSGAQIASISTVLVVSAEALFYLGLLLAGRQAWEKIKTYFPWYKAPGREYPRETIAERPAQNQPHTGLQRGESDGGGGSQ